MVILDSSVILAMLNNEPGHAEARQLCASGAISSVILAEVTGILVARHKIPLSEVRSLMEKLIGHVIHFNEQQAFIAAELELLSRTNNYGLSLADRACIALGASLKLPIYTADKVWAQVSFANTTIKLIR
jgi:PIN domain nuclease of toxin-antitoxin system